MNRLRLALAASALTLMGCATQTEKLSCLQRDWYEIGRRDGAQGAPLDRVERYQTECHAQLRDKDAMIYTNGRNAGLVEYCQPESGFQLGRAGRAYQRVCPSTVEAAFLAAHRRGQQIRQLEQRNKDIDAQIEMLSDRLLRAELSEQPALSTQLARLKVARAKLERELSRVTR